MGRRMNLVEQGSQHDSDDAEFEQDMQLEATEPMAAQHNMEVKKLSKRKSALGEKVVEARKQVHKASLA